MNFFGRTVLASVYTLSLVACGSDTRAIVAGEVLEENGSSPEINTGTVDGTSDVGTEATDTDTGTTDDTTDEAINLVRVDAGTQRLTLNDNQQELNADVTTSSQFAITDDGRYLLFSTAATNVLATGDTEDTIIDVYLRDTLAGSVTKVNQAVSGSSNDGNSSSEGISDDGRFSVFTSVSKGVHPEANGSLQVYLYDALSQSNTLISRTPTGDAGRGNSANPFIAVNGDTVVFTSQAQNINRAFSGRTSSVFAYDVATATISEVVPGSQLNSSTFLRAIDVSRDARYVLYRNGLDIINAVYFVIDRTANELVQVPANINSDFGLKISDTGRYLIAQNSLSEERPILWIDLQQNIRVELGLDILVPNWAGPEFNQRAMPDEISDNGQTILYHGMLFDGQLPATSENRFWNVYAITISERDAVLISRGIDQISGNRESNFPQFSNNEQSIIYHSYASNLIEGDNNFRGDIFITPFTM